MAAAKAYIATSTKVVNVCGWIHGDRSADVGVQTDIDMVMRATGQKINYWALHV